MLPSLLFMVVDTFWIMQNFVDLQSFTFNMYILKFWNIQQLKSDKLCAVHEILVGKIHIDSYKLKLKELGSKLSVTKFQSRGNRTTEDH